MEQTGVLERIESMGEGAVTTEEASYALKVTALYQDNRTWQWAADMCNRVTQFAGARGIHARSWRVAELAQPAIFPGAVQAATLADVIVVSVYAAAQLPHSFYTWINAWVPRRRLRTGTLVALIGVPDSPNLHTPFIQEYLAGVADRGELDFLPRQETTGRRSG